MSPEPLILDASALVARRFEEISKRCGPSGRPEGLPHADRLLWYVVATRCEKDINGIESVFDQLLNEEELLFMVDSLMALQEPELAAAFQSAHAALAVVNFYGSGAQCHDFGDVLARELESVDAALDEDGRLWRLDEKLTRLAHGAGIASTP